MPEWNSTTIAASLEGTKKRIPWKWPHNTSEDHAERRNNKGKWGIYPEEPKEPDKMQQLHELHKIQQLHELYKAISITKFN